MNAWGCQREVPVTPDQTLHAWHLKNQKKTPVPRLPLRVVAAAGARGNSPAGGGLKQSARFFPAAPSMLGAGQRGAKT